MNSEQIFLYMIKMILISGIFLGYYWLALRNKKFHYYNRFYLLLSLLLSITIPLVPFTWITIDQPNMNATGEVMNYIITIGSTPVVQHRNWIDLALLSFFCVSTGLLLMLAIHIHTIYRLKKNSVVTRMGDIDFIDTEEDNAPFSYLQNLFWKRSISLEQEAGRQIFQHELTHIRQKHTLDRLFCQLLCSVIWINPFYWIIKKELLTIHEFIADEKAIGKADTESFARMLLEAQYGNHFFQQTQSFFYSSIKRRLLMLTASENVRYSYARRLIALPLLVFTIVAFSLQVKASEKDKIVLPQTDATVTDKTTMRQKDSIIKKYMRARGVALMDSLINSQKNHRYPLQTAGIKTTKLLYRYRKSRNSPAVRRDGRNSCMKTLTVTGSFKKDLLRESMQCS